jgi:hypothetical protein
MQRGRAAGNAATDDTHVAIDRFYERWVGRRWVRACTIIGVIGVPEAHDACDFRQLEAIRDIRVR